MRSVRAFPVKSDAVGCRPRLRDQEAGCPPEASSSREPPAFKTSTTTSTGFAGRDLSRHSASCEPRGAMPPGALATGVGPIQQDRDQQGKLPSVQADEAAHQEREGDQTEEPGTRHCSVECIPSLKRLVRRAAVSLLGKHRDRGLLQHVVDDVRAHGLRHPVLGLKDEPVAQDRNGKALDVIRYHVGAALQGGVCARQA